MVFQNFGSVLTTSEDSNDEKKNNKYVTIRRKKHKILKLFVFSASPNKEIIFYSTNQQPVMINGKCLIVIIIDLLKFCAFTLSRFAVLELIDHLLNSDLF